MACPCCDQSRCCCLGESPLNYTTNYRRIISVANAGDCTGTVISSSSSPSCPTILVQWCGLTVELTTANTNATVQDFPGTVGRGCGTGSDNVVNSRTLSITKDNIGLSSPMGWGAECNRCVFRFLVTYQENSFECGSNTRQFFIDWREGCDANLHIEFVAGDSGFFICNDLTPTVSLTFAP